uniref:Uncharacterized protein n=1 Tax=Romanomermis culicivorax TaxID=13658 RepID=A0A915JQS3_ROMCU
SRVSKIEALESRVSKIEASNQLSITQNLNSLNIEMVVCDAIERESKKANAVLFGLPVTDANDLDEVQKIVTDFGAKLLDDQGLNQDSKLNPEDIV